MSDYWLRLKDPRDLSHDLGECHGNMMSVNKTLSYLIMQYTILHEFHHAYKQFSGDVVEIKPKWKIELGAQFWATLGCPIGSLLAKIRWLLRMCK